MKKIALFSVFILLAAAWKYRTATELPQKTINTLLDDISFIDKYGRQPTIDDDEDIRIHTHLEYVENQLRHADVSGLSADQQHNRQHLLALLRDYRERGIYPRNYDFPDERKPCFIDKDGRICAVGYLIEQTAGRKTAEAINRAYQYETIMEMNDPLVDNWIASSGLTKEECAMIQPGYGSQPIIVYETNRIPKGYGISSALLSGANVTVNVIQIGRGAKHGVAPWVGLATGAAQATMGIIRYPQEEISAFGELTNNVGERNISLLNIGLGTATVLLSSWNLIANTPRSGKGIRWGFQRMTTPDGYAGLGIQVMKQF